MWGLDKKQEGEVTQSEGMFHVLQIQQEKDKRKEEITIEGYLRSKLLLKLSWHIWAVV